jgi:hypothetical protein
VSEEALLRQEQELIELGTRMVEAAKAKGLSVRLLGAVAFRIHCPAFRHWEHAAGRWLTDLDFACYGREADRVASVFAAEGFEEDLRVRALHGTQRRVFNHPSGWHADLFVDRLRFCHDVEFRGRLEADFPTIPLAELLLEKLQIVALEPKDALDSFVLLREHQVGDGDRETVNAGLIARIMADDWGFWKTVTTNLERMREYAQGISVYGVRDQDRKDVVEKVETLIERIEREPKTMRWRMRARVGTRIPWYRTVEEMTRQ